MDQRQRVTDAPPRADASQWGELRKRMQEVFLTKTRDEWAELFAERPACVTPVLRMSEAPQHPHLRARSAMVEHESVMRPNVAPRFSRTPSKLPPAGAVLFVGPLPIVRGSGSPCRALALIERR